MGDSGCEEVYCKPLAGVQAVVLRVSTVFRNVGGVAVVLLYSGRSNSLMKKILTASLLAACALPAYKISSDEQTLLVNHLQTTAKELRAAVKGLSPEQFKFKAGPDRWSVAECLEHISTSEEFIRQVTERALKSTPKPEGIAERKKNDGKLLEGVVDRSQKFQAPEPLRPSNKFATPQAALDHFLKARKDTIVFAKTTDADLRAYTAPHPVFKELDGYQWLLLLSGHSSRHTKQILEVKADPNFPKK